MVYEQYYGDEVALFGKDERQNDPHAITAGLSYTPVPLIPFSAEQRQGKQGENDTRIGMELTLQPGHSLQNSSIRLKLQHDVTLWAVAMTGRS